MRICALLSWFDEEPASLAACVSSLSRVPVDHLVAVDGAYVLYPDSLRRWRSAQEQAEAIAGAAYGVGMGLTLYIPDGPWMGNEVEKRNHLFSLGRQVARRIDWFLIIDGDELVQSAFQVREELERCEADDDMVAYCRLVEADGTPNSLRRLYRNDPRLQLRTTHYGYTLDDVPLWDGHGTPAGVLTDNLVLEHRRRQGSRDLRKWEYYRARDELGAERV